MLILSLLLLIILLAPRSLNSFDATVSRKISDEQSCTKESCNKSKRYLLYDVNPGEGFNLRRDVYIRAAVLVKFLNKNDSKSDWTLVLPPWGPLYHWKRQDLNQDGMAWSAFFDIDSLNQFVPVVEFDDYLAIRKQPVIDHLFYLLNFDFGKVDLQSEWLLEENECSDLAGFPYHSDAEGHIRGWFWGYDGIFTKAVSCFQVLGTASAIVPMLIKHASVKERAIMFDHFETVLHDNFGSVEYWLARRSMRFADDLIRIGNEVRQRELNSSIEVSQDDRFDAKIGDPFICAHLRRQDYLQARSDELPSMREAALQLRKLLKDSGLSTVFVATDGTAEEIQDLRKNLPSAKVVVYKPALDVLRRIKEGGAAIVEQWVCSHARIFIGSYESTFSFRIQEEREILGFPPESTFNRFCKLSDQSCEQPTRWQIAS